MLVRRVLGWKMLDDVAAAVAKELELLTVGPIGARQLQEQDVEVVGELCGRQAGDLIFLPDFQPA